MSSRQDAIRLDDTDRALIEWILTFFTVVCLATAEPTRLGTTQQRGKERGTFLRPSPALLPSRSVVCPRIIDYSQLILTKPRLCQASLPSRSCLYVSARTSTGTVHNTLVYTQASIECTSASSPQISSSPCKLKKSAFLSFPAPDALPCPVLFCPAGSRGCTALHYLMHYLMHYHRGTYARCTIGTSPALPLSSRAHAPPFLVAPLASWLATHCAQALI